MRDIISEVLRLDAEATPGPWGPAIQPESDYVRAIVAGRENVLSRVWGNDCNNALLISTYRTAAPALARECQDLRERLATLEADSQVKQECLDGLRRLLDEEYCRANRAEARVAALEATLRRVRALEVTP